MQSIYEDLVKSRRDTQNLLIISTILLSVSTRLSVLKYSNATNSKEAKYFFIPISYYWTIGGITLLVSLGKYAYSGAKASTLTSGAAAGFFTSLVGCVLTDIPSALMRFYR